MDAIRFIWWSTLLLLIIKDCSFTLIINIYAFTMMSPSCISLNYIKTSISSLCMMMNILNTYWGISTIWAKKSSSWGKLGSMRWLLMLTKMLSRPTTKCTLGTKCEWSGGLVVWKGNGDNWWKVLIPQNPSTHICSKL